MAKKEAAGNASFDHAADFSPQVRPSSLLNTRHFSTAALLALVLPLRIVASLPTLLIAGVGLFMVYSGIHRGTEYYPLLQQTPVRMTVVKVENRNHRRVFPDYEATGVVGDGRRIDVAIFANQFHQLRPGSSLLVYRLPAGGWINRAKLDECRPIFSVFALHFSWHLPMGILLLIAWFGLLPYLRRKQRRRTSVSLEKEKS